MALGILPATFHFGSKSERGTLYVERYPDNAGALYAKPDTDIGALKAVNSVAGFVKISNEFFVFPLCGTTSAKEQLFGLMTAPVAAQLLEDLAIHARKRIFDVHEKRKVMRT